MGEVTTWSTTDASNTDLFPEGMAFSAVNDGGRAVQGAIARWFQDINGSLAASGSSNAFTLTSNRSIGSLADGTRMSFKANHSITGAATLNLNGLGAKDIKRFNGSALASGDIISGQVVDVVYSSSADDWFMVSAAAALIGSTHADFAENASPGNPAANTGRLYAKDDGGLTILAYRDSAGTEAEVLNSTVIQRVYAEDATVITASTAIPVDDTIPQNTEGTEVITASITLKKSANRVRVRAAIPVAAEASGGMTIAAALFRSGTASAIHTAFQNAGVSSGNVGLVTPLSVLAEDAPGAVGPFTYSIRVGGNATAYINASSTGTRRFGGSSKATLVLEEVHV